MMTWIAWLVLGLVSAGAPSRTPPEGAARSHVGLVTMFADESCHGWRARPVRFDIVAAETGKTAHELRFQQDGSKPLELVRGRYDVRLYVRYKGGYSYYDTASLAALEDGWIVGFGCPRPTRKPALWSG